MEERRVKPHCVLSGCHFEHTPATHHPTQDQASLISTVLSLTEHQFIHYHTAGQGALLCSLPTHLCHLDTSVTLVVISVHNILLQEERNMRRVGEEP